ncbi:IRE protein kinase [Capronia coronata CBS 617.96]|uniref:non-specific serine/threonine protein kinase n=1 Tax=Capronia coronata CBS 617.96 TaxID=1182541 RepID=W9XDV0_9EURO|nr:IRE protein kinase [Capronia coronata CBS 617.96]EXJ78657.1 IRE protein kinase [Capronia coronata CBS 617.96]
MAKPPLRPPGRRGGSKTVLTWAFLLLLIAAVHPQSVPHHESVQRLVASTQSIRPDASRRPQAGRSPAEIPLLKNDIATVKFRSTDENPENHKLRALAPAHDSSSAVRAPLVQTAESSRLSALPSARLLQDWEVENIIILATIDGTIHACDRKTGNERWSLGIPNSPMIETIHHAVNRSDQDASHYEDDFIFIVEPSKDGNLYIQHRDPRIGLQRLGVTVKSLAAETPQFVDDPPLVTIASQETTAYVVDAATGNILQQFDKHRGFSTDDEDRSCRRLSGFELDGPACESLGTLNLGRVEYTVQISHKITNQPLCTIKFAEWVPNKGDSDLQSQYIAPLDNFHIQSYYNGRIIGIDNNADAAKVHRFTHMLDTPVARVFDVVRPLDNRDASPKLVLLARPTDSPLMSTPQIWRDETQRAERVFVNKTESGVWYALSELSYPGVTSGAAPASSHWNYDNHPLNFKSDMEEIVGVHVLSTEPDNAPLRLTISGPPPATDLAEEAARDIATIGSKIAPSLSPVLNHPLMSVFNLIVISVIFLFVVGIQMKLPWMLKMQQHLRKAGFEVAVEKAEPPASVPAAPTQTTGDREIPVADVEQAKDEPQIVSQALENAIATPSRSRAESVAVSTSSPVKNVKLNNGNDESSEGDSEDDKGKQESNLGENTEAGAQPRFRHAKRGKRGGRKNKKGKKTMDPQAMDEKEELVVEVPTKDGMLQVGRLRIDTREDRCLGRGSNGTAVFPGTLDGREVAVKRLIRTSNSLAAKEIKHLLSSDENPHVIRYFGKEESQHFTYIALELFTTSLDQFIERPLQFPNLVKFPEGFDVKDALRQITDGVQHLHSLKLVHRDIKPQNVLVKAVKSNRPPTGLPKLQFVISDFGLCKPLEEGPESTFAPTANHTAAGTTGWRAPELLVHSRSTITASNTTSSTSKSTTHSSNGTVIDRPSGRRATKAIDIFSLGCVFYYVMTQGRHPFDVGGSSLGRDLNIKENKFSTEDLRLHDYQYDADDLIMQMLKHDPKERPDTTEVLRHPYFWDVADKLEFLCDVSDCYEREKNSIKNIFDENAIRTPAEKEALAELAALESLAPNVIGPSRDFLRALPKSFVNEMGKQRKYSGSKMIDLLRVIRNKKNHFHDLPDDVKEQMLGGSPKGYYEFWAKRFPSLLINCHCLILERDLVGRFRMERYYE